MPIDVDALIASLGPEFDALLDALPDDPWGGANLANCGECPACRPSAEDRR